MATTSKTTFTFTCDRCGAANEHNGTERHPLLTYGGKFVDCAAAFGTRIDGIALHGELCGPCVKDFETFIKAKGRFQ
jgi:hypothetical protein